MLDVHQANSNAVDKHDHHHHAPSPDANKRYLSLALLLLGAFMLFEVVLGIMASSLALLSDAGHMLTDVGAIGLSLFAMSMARRPAAGHYTWGFKRVEILSAQANGLTLLLLALWFVFEGVQRLFDPPEVRGALVLLVAVIGIFVNLIVVWVMAKADRRSLNIEGSFQHVLTDLYAFIATAVAGAIVWATGWNEVDAIAALIVAALMLRAGYGLIRDSGRVFMEAAPAHIDPNAVRAAICGTPAVTGVQDLHIWEVTSGLPALSAHLYVSTSVDCHDKRREVVAMLRERFNISHATLQTDHADTAPSGVSVCTHQEF